VLLCRLRLVKNQCSFLQIDIALVSADRAIIAWERSLNCSACRQDDSNNTLEILLLLLMGIRTILYILGHMILNLLDGIEQQKPTSRTSRHQQRRDGGLGVARSMIGLYEMEKDESELVTKLLLSRILDRTNAVIHPSRERSEALRVAGLTRGESTGMGSPMFAGEMQVSD
jgi:hypothetical protein